MSESFLNYKGPSKLLMTDMDGTMTTENVLLPETFERFCKLKEHGLKVVVVTGRPAGWGHAIASLWPVDAVVTENGGVTFTKKDGLLKKRFAVADKELPAWRDKMFEAVAKLQHDIPQMRLSTDSAYREVDLAIDWNEDFKLPLEVADEIVDTLLSQDFVASRSSVHVNFSPPGFDKYIASMNLIDELFPEFKTDKEAVLYVGDSLNDAPMFKGFPNTVGVANVKQWWDKLPSKPRYLTTKEEGLGFVEMVDHVLGLLS